MRVVECAGILLKCYVGRGVTHLLQLIQLVSILINKVQVSFNDLVHELTLVICDGQNQNIKYLCHLSHKKKGGLKLQTLHGNNQLKICASSGPLELNPGGGVLGLHRHQGKIRGQRSCCALHSGHKPARIRSTSHAPQC